MQLQRCFSTTSKGQPAANCRRFSQPHRRLAAASKHSSSRTTTPARAAAAVAPQRRQRTTAVAVHSMFTGIVQGMATVKQVQQAGDGSFKSFRIEFPDSRAAGVQIGASVAVNGTCLTVTAIEGDVLSFDVMQETLRATSLGGLQVGSRVNFERSARVGDEIGGHTVSGHVHTTAAVVDVAATQHNRRLTFELADPSWAKYVLPKGFISLDGCSLTVGEVEGSRFSVYLIPETLRVTVFGTKGVGDAVNVEVEAQTQAIVDTVERVVAQYLANGATLSPPQQQAQQAQQQQQPQQQEGVAAGTAAGAGVGGS